MTSELETVESQWDEQAEKWNQWIGDDGDVNRRESSDIYLWKYIGNVENKVILDAGCGNGYLTIKFALETRAKRIIGVDLSSVMIKLAKENINR
jgi:2-polyprenyl-3-methyl-5-hydroxy-6-metoxy-1,4-benzoquinol methylase